MSNRIGGSFRSTNYIGIKADNPPNIWNFTRDPNSNDIQGYAIGDEWQNNNTLNFWKLYTLQGNPTSKGALANWQLMGGPNGTLLNLQPDVGNVIYPLLGTILLHNQDGNIITSSFSIPETANTLNINFANSIVINNNITALNGIITGTQMAGTVSLHLYNTFNGSINPVDITTLKNKNGGAVQNGDYLSQIVSMGYDVNSAATPSAVIRCVVDGPVGANAVPGQWQFFTGPSSPLPANPRMYITSNGNVIINAPTIANSAQALKVTGSIAANGDSGAQVDGSIAFTNVPQANPGAVADRINGTGQGNAAWIKIYVNGVTAYIPYWTTI